MQYNETTTIISDIYAA